MLTMASGVASRRQTCLSTTSLTWDPAKCRLTSGTAPLSRRCWSWRTERATRVSCCRSRMASTSRGSPFRALGQQSSTRRITRPRRGQGLGSPIWTCPCSCCARRSWRRTARTHCQSLRPVMCTAQRNRWQRQSEPCRSLRISSTKAILHGLRTSAQRWPLAAMSRSRRGWNWRESPRGGWRSSSEITERSLQSTHPRSGASA
mmetsp:Transcript_3450/g.10605  ORF Transcript_3450/g.10605 Transcript_3450/m.10605 type:complete len:203 (-) Transcript_3450:514-1122(-)